MPPNDSRATFTAVLPDIECALDGAGQPTVRGHAAVFNRRSHDLGGFRTMIAPGAFDRVLDTNPDVHLLWDHNTRYTLARTKNKSLELRVDPHGLHVWARMANTPTAHELATLMDGGYVDQMSFACDIGEDEWTEDPDGEITRTIYSVSGLYDVTICAQGAFPQTDAQLVASMKDAGAELAAAVAAGRVIRRATPDLAAALGSDGEQEGIAPGAGADGVAEAEEPTGATAVAEVRAARLAALQERAEACYQQHTRAA